MIGRWWRLLALTILVTCGAGLVAADIYDLESGQTVAVLDHFQDCDVCREMIVLPLGTFTMGAPPEQSEALDFWRKREPGEPGGLKTEGPVHEVEIDIPIAIGRNEVTHDEWMACVADGGCPHTPDGTVLTRRGRITVTGRNPVMNVSYDDIQHYTAWLNGKVGAEVYRLPTEAEWEYAARAGTTTRFAQGETLTKDQANFLYGRWIGPGNYESDDSIVHRTPIPVDQLDAANGWGLRHMSGNVLERTMSCAFERHLGLPTSSAYLRDAQQRAPCDRVGKGGDYGAGSDHARPSNRGRAAQNRRSDSTGFRVLRELK